MCYPYIAGHPQLSAPLLSVAVLFGLLCAIARRHNNHKTPAAVSVCRIHMAPAGRGNERSAAPLASTGCIEQHQDQQENHIQAVVAEEVAAVGSNEMAGLPPAKRPHVAQLIGKPKGAAAADAAQQAPGNAYERQRAERMARNQRVLQEMGVQEASQQVQQAANVPRSWPHNSAMRQPTKHQKQEAAAAPSRQSARLRAATVEPAADGKLAAAPADTEGRGDYQEELLTQEEYFAALGQPLTGFSVDGEYHGWVSPAVCERYGIASSASEAWESNGGGAFKRTITKADVPAHLRAKGWSDARAFSSTQLLKNPNTYFYRHVAPHEQQAQGEWTQEEHELFLATARQHGVGTKWGLFASHIPQRVGYQCSAYYREVMIPEGLIVDSRFRLAKGGRAVYEGPAGAAQADS